MKITEREYLVLLYSFISFGPTRIKLLSDYFGSYERIWRAGKKDLIDTGLKDKTVNDFIRFRENLNIEGYFKKLKNLSISYLLLGDADYPVNLKEIEGAPTVLYIKGEIKKRDERAIAIVGARRMTPYGREVTEKFVKELSAYGITIVSGLARGIDTCAHKTALLVGGRTLAVVASGLDIIYPPENTYLEGEIIKRGGAVISEYPLGYPPLARNFPARNRIISGLSKAVLVVEGAKKSGTLLTASAAANQGREVFAIPGPITSPMSEATLFLIQNGAKIASSAKDILDDLD
jgi:DNA processing protein